jgi:hypothetical protein
LCCFTTNTTVAPRQISPETDENWRPPKVAHTLSAQKLTEGPALDDVRIDALVAFMKTHHGCAL